MTPSSPTPIKIPDLHPWEKYMPSKKIQLVIGVIIIVGILFGLRNPIINLFKKIKYNSVIPLVTIQDPKIEQPTVPLSVDKDTDGDGLMDWQEILIGSNPDIANSNQEIPQEVRDLVNSSNNTLVDTSEKIALRIYQRLKTDPKGANIQEAIQAATTKEMLDYADSLDKQLTTYTLDDLTLVDDTKESRASYEAAVSPSITKAIQASSTIQEIYTKLLTGETKSSTATPHIVFAEVSTKLREAPVPLKLAPAHLSLLNAITHMSQILAKVTPEMTTTDQTTTYASMLVFQKNLNLAMQMTTTLSSMLLISNPN